MKPDAPRTIDAATLYQLDEAKARLGVAKAAWRTMVKQGLPVVRIGRRGYVVGADVIAFLRKQGQSEDAGQ